MKTKTLTIPVATYMAEECYRLALLLFVSVDALHKGDYCTILPAANVREELRKAKGENA